MLYLVNSSEDPRDAGYLPAEMRILGVARQAGRRAAQPLGPPRPDEQEQAEQARWKARSRPVAIVRDAARSWTRSRAAGCTRTCSTSVSGR